MFKKKKELSNTKTIRTKTEGPRSATKIIVGEANLPHEIIVKIFEYLGALNVCKVSRTCQFWRDSSNDSGLWKYFCRCAIFKSLSDNYEEGTKEPKDTMCQRFCEKQMKLLTRVKESATSATSTNFWKDKYLNMLMDDIRSLYAHKEIIFWLYGGPRKAWQNNVEVLKYRPDKSVKEETLVPETIYKVITLVNSDRLPSEFCGIFQTIDGYYLLLNCWDKKLIKHWDLETLLTGFTSQRLRQIWQLPTLKQFGKFWTNHKTLISIPAELRWYLIKAGLKLIKSCDACYSKAMNTVRDTANVMIRVDTTVTCETCSGSGDALIFETIDTPSTLSGGNKKIDRDVYSAQQILLRISTQWRKHQVQLIDRQLSALLSQSRRKNEQQEGDEAKQERKRKFDELVVGSDTKQDEISSKKFKLIQSNEESDNLPTSGGWNTWLSKKGYGGIQNFMNWLNEKRPLPFLADVLYPTEFADGYPFLTDAWRTLASVISSHTLMLNNELFAADQVRRGELQQFIEKHPTLPRASVYSYGIMKLQQWKQQILLQHTP
jgi:hypothetical protein